MLPQLLFIIGALSAAWLVLDWFKRAKPAAARRVLQRAGLAALVGLGLWLVLTGKLAGLLAVAAGLAPWVMRALKLHDLWRMVRALLAAGPARRPGAKGGGASHVHARFVRMDLDHASGHLDGEVLDGSLRGRSLSGLSRAEADVLWREAAADPDSARLLEAWLDRAWPDWRAAAPPPPPHSPSGAMTPEEAREILGVGPHAGADDIRAAHRRLMMANHPDHGGSTWLAARINQARDLLLGH